MVFQDQPLDVMSPQLSLLYCLGLQAVEESLVVPGVKEEDGGKEKEKMKVEVEEEKKGWRNRRTRSKRRRRKIEVEVEEDEEAKKETVDVEGGEQ